MVQFPLKVFPPNKLATSDLRLVERYPLFLFGRQFVWFVLEIDPVQQPLGFSIGQRIDEPVQEFSRGSLGRYRGDCTLRPWLNPRSIPRRSRR